MGCSILVSLATGNYSSGGTTHWRYNSPIGSGISAPVQTQIHAKYTRHLLDVQYDRILLASHSSSVTSDDHNQIRARPLAEIGRSRTK